ncbi:UDP-3-O-(3-hydroxymyristoyl)glucosamine N-acyltransferase [Elusimicrobiota bacterium]
MENRKQLKIGEIVKITGGELEGGSDKVSEIIIKGVNTLESAGKGEISFLANPKYKKWVENTSASCILISENSKVETSTPVIKVEDPIAAFRKVVSNLFGEIKHPVIGESKNISKHETVQQGDNVRIGEYVKIESGVKLGSDIVIYPHVYIGENVEIGDGCILHPNVTVRDTVKIGDNVIIHSGSVIGSEGFGYSTQKGKHLKIPQVGGVIVGNDVEIGSNVCIDRGSPGDTVIGDGTKIDNLVQIAHNVRIGKSCLIISQVGIAGSTIVEDYVVLAGQAGVVGHITIGEGARIGAQSGVTHDIEPGQVASGYPATEHRKARRLNALIKKLPQLFKDVEKLSKTNGTKGND